MSEDKCPGCKRLALRDLGYCRYCGMSFVNQPRNQLGQEKQKNAQLQAVVDKMEEENEALLRLTDKLDNEAALAAKEGGTK